MVTRIQPKRDARFYLVEWRIERKLTLEQLAEKAGTTKQSISRWGTGKRDITLKSLVAVAEALNIEVADLFRDPADNLAELFAVAVKLNQRERSMVLGLMRDMMGEEPRQPASVHEIVNKRH